jgi:hypothetical protein
MFRVALLAWLWKTCEINPLPQHHTFGDVNSSILLAPRQLGNQPTQSFAENGLRRDEAEHEKATSAKVEKVPRMYQHIGFAEQGERELLIGTDGGNPQHDVPAPFDAETMAKLLPRKLRIQLGKIAANSLTELPLDGVPDLQQRRRGKLHGCIR